jgi:TRAP-type C4-dicarboxylate transport system substrate-binding protein
VDEKTGESTSLSLIRTFQKIFDKTLQKLTLAQTTLWGNFEQEMVQKLDSFEQVQSRFVREISQRVEENAKDSKKELIEAAKIEKR